MFGLLAGTSLLGGQAAGMPSTSATSAATSGTSGNTALSSGDWITGGQGVPWWVLALALAAVVLLLWRRKL